MTTRREGVCTLLQDIGLPAVRVKTVSAEVIEFNELFSSLVRPVGAMAYPAWFVKGVLPFVTAADRTSWAAAFDNQTSVQIHVVFKTVDGRALNYEMRSFSPPGPKKPDQSILCVFIPFTTPVFERICDTHLSEGRELERCRIRNELHHGISQRLLGAAFGCKALAAKVAILSEGLGKDASDLAELVNEAVIELQSLVHSDQNQS
ncbi:MAG: histidine kinase dimerization/phosphoacceptor domain-containing protein [Verrucomicrobia bacterium]|nr:histidine kinase dimerization/phosphoacceptor domain-containing protein [Verrucomicrobiota bacterium]